MADRPLLPTSIQLLVPPAPIRTPGGEFLPHAPAVLETFMKTVVARLNGGISFGDGEQSTAAGHLDAQTIRWVFAAANTEYEVPHGLGRTPIGYIVIDRDVASTLYSSNRGGWTSKALFLKASAISEQVFIVF